MLSKFKLSLTSGRLETVIVEDDTPKVADLLETFAKSLDFDHLNKRYCSASHTKGFNPLVAWICPF